MARAANLPDGADYMPGDPLAGPWAGSTVGIGRPKSASRGSPTVGPAPTPSWRSAGAAVLWTG